MKTKELFELWYKEQFPSAHDDLLDFNEITGYLDDTVNAMWIGFNGRDLLTR